VSVPTEKQYGILRVLGSGSAGLSFKKRTTEPLLRRGWVTADWRPPYYQFVRITPDGLRALALAVEKFGLPDLGPHPMTEAKVCVECDRDWFPACSCGSRRYRFIAREVAA
jgi:hypothetical protein